MNEVVIDTRSTALALPFLTPGLASAEVARVVDLLGRAAALPEIAPLSGLIGAVAPVQADYLDDARIESAWTTLASKLSAPTAPPTSPRRRGELQTLSPAALFLKSLTSDYTGNIPSTPVSLTPKLEPLPDDVLDRARFVLKPEDHFNIDWFIEFHPSLFTPLKIQ
ncbi:MAG: hypothetical protein EXS36_16145 [Pedosphaera sp.]|nr:hypothetical protein [Pedosphaera sp.]